MPVFANVELTGDDYDAFEIWAKEVAPDFHEGLEILTKEGYKVSFRFDQDDEFHSCFFTMSEEVKHHNANLTVGSAGETPEEAFLFNVYKVHILHNGRRLPSSGGKKRRG